MLYVDAEEFLYLFNLRKARRPKLIGYDIYDQGFLNAVYLWEKFDIGLHFNVRSGVVQLPKMAVHVENATVFHFAWLFKPDKCPPVHPMRKACYMWKYFRQKMENYLENRSSQQSQ